MVACAQARWGSGVVAVGKRGAVGSCLGQHGSGVGSAARQNGGCTRRRNGSKIGGYQLATHHCLDGTAGAVRRDAYSNVVVVKF